MYLLFAMYILVCSSLHISIKIKVQLTDQIKSVRFSCSTQNEPNDGMAASFSLNWESVECTMKVCVYPSLKTKRTKM